MRNDRGKARMRFSCGWGLLWVPLTTNRLGGLANSNPGQPGHDRRRLLAKGKVGHLDTLSRMQVLTRLRRYKRYQTTMWRERALPQPAIFIEPCLPRPAKQPPAGPGWMLEIKHDGFRLMAQRAVGHVRLERVKCHGIDCDQKFKGRSQLE
jgi:bifunctional non-homologous end joining protein LigD